jgi:hypothetical protein
MIIIIINDNNNNKNITANNLSELINIVNSDGSDLEFYKMVQGCH